MAGVFITGTDTGVGKTLATLSLGLALGEAGVDVGVMKPVETGAPLQEGRRTGGDAALLRRLIVPDDSPRDVNPIALELPAAPAAAARHAGVTIDIGLIRAAYARLSARHEIVLVEGAGGLLVPLDAKITMADLALTLRCPLIVVARKRLGTINHTLLTLREAGRLGCRVLGVILNEWDASGEPLSNADRINLEALRERLEVPLLAELPRADPGPAGTWSHAALQPLVQAFRQRGGLEALHRAIVSSELQPCSK